MEFKIRSSWLLFTYLSFSQCFAQEFKYDFSFEEAVLLTQIPKLVSGKINIVPSAEVIGFDNKGYKMFYDIVDVNIPNADHYNKQLDSWEASGAIGYSADTNNIADTYKQVLNASGLYRGNQFGYGTVTIPIANDPDNIVFTIPKPTCESCVGTGILPSFPGTIRDGPIVASNMAPNKERNNDGLYYSNHLKVQMLIKDRVEQLRSAKSLHEYIPFYGEPQREMIFENEATAITIVIPSELYRNESGYWDKFRITIVHQPVVMEKVFFKFSDEDKNTEITPDGYKVLVTDFRYRKRGLNWGAKNAPEPSSVTNSLNEEHSGKLETVFAQRLAEVSIWTMRAIFQTR